MTAAILPELLLALAPALAAPVPRALPRAFPAPQARRIPAAARPALPELSRPIVVDRARFTVIAPECIRLEYSRSRRFVDAPSLFALRRQARWTGYRLERSSTSVVIDTGRIRLTYHPDGKSFSARNLSAEISGGGVRSEWRAGLGSPRDLGGTRNLDGAKGPLPMDQGLLSRDGWKVVDDSHGILLKDGWAADRAKAVETDWYLFGYGADYKAALRALTELSGAVPLPRRYALGSWYSRWWPHSADDYKRVVAEYHEHGFPLDVLVMDMDWHTADGWTGYTWNRALFPNPTGYLAWIHEQGLFATLNEHPGGGVQPYEERYPAFMRALGKDPAAKETRPYDPGDRRSMEAEFGLVHDPIERQGVDFWWLDHWSDEAAHPLNRLAWLNELYFRRSERGGRRGLAFSRWGDWGDHRHPMLFSGDSYILWSTLAFEVPFTANSGNVGAFFWSHDIGGYQGKRDGELLARWAQFGAFSAALRLHSMKDPALDKRPWSYDGDVEESMRRSFELRSRLFPYTYSSAWQSHDRSVPLLRPLYLEHPVEEEAYANPQEYLYGDAFLVAPIVSPGQGRRKLAAQDYWLPEGLWYDWFSGEAIRGPAKGQAWATLDELPLFARGGWPIPMQPFTERMGTAPISTLVVRAYPGEEGKPGRFDLYEDDGLSQGYLKGARALTPLTYLKRGGVVTVSIGPTEGRFDGQRPDRGLIFELPGERIARAEVDGVVAAVVEDPRTGVASVALPPGSIRSRRTLAAWTQFTPP